MKRLRVLQTTLLLLIVVLQSCNYECFPPLTEDEKTDYESTRNELQNVGRVELDHCFREIKIFQHLGNSIDSALVQSSIKNLNHKHGGKYYRVALYDSQGMFVGGFYETSHGKVIFTKSFDY